MEDVEYFRYNFSKKEWLFYSCQGVAIIILVSYLFYGTFWAMLIFFPFLHFFLKEKQRVLGKKRKEQFSQQFKEGINVVAGALSVGYSIENAWIAAYKDMYKLYGEKETITQEFGKISHQVELNIPIEKVMEDLGRRTQIEDIISFGDIFQVAQKTGGDLVQITQTTAKVISEKVEIEREIQTIIAGKQLEQKAMQWIPFGIMIFVKSTSIHYFVPVYGNLFGVVIMTGCLISYVTAVLLGKKLVEIEV